MLSAARIDESRSQNPEPGQAASTAQLRVEGDDLVGAQPTSDEARGDASGARPRPPQPAGSCPTLSDFYHSDSPDLFAKCRSFAEAVEGLKEQELFQCLYRVKVLGALGNRIIVEDPFSGAGRELICFDSNSYLQLHRHPRVVRAVHRALQQVGYGTASAQLLCGHNRYLRELEETVARFHGREDTIVFSSGFTANLGAITGIVRARDLVVCDRFSHASIHDACRASGARHRTFPHLDLEALDGLLSEATSPDAGTAAKLIVTDGVFSMHGDLAPLPGLVELARRHGARLMVDEAHSTGVIGPTGRGLEERFGLPGSIDLLMGTFSKAPGTIGGYVTGRREVVEYLRFFARSAMFTAALPAALCAGITESFRVMEEEPEHRESLWRNVALLHRSLREAGFEVAAPESPILPIFMGAQSLMMCFSRDLFRAGIKAGNVGYPAVPLDETLVRLSVNAYHTEQDLSQTVEILARLARRYGILRKSREEIQEIGSHLSLGAAGRGGAR
jgi:8-amino-7-oxononanoate synthase